MRPVTGCRTVMRRIQSIATSDGAGVQLRRSLGNSPHTRVDPFLMLDEFSSYDPADYIAGFPAHPHRGFETVTYMLDGHLLHEDHLGNRGDLRSGDVQWMTAGRGIIHSEMPQQIAGRLRGFQLWINLPAAEKLRPASYRDIPAASIPLATLAGGAQARVIAGELTDADGVRRRGPVHGLSTAPVFLDLQLPAGTAAEIPLPASHAAFLYPYEGRSVCATAETEVELPLQCASVLGEGASLRVRALEAARCLLLAARPLREPVVQYGPFVMNTRAEIEQAVDDYQSGRLTA